VNELSERNIPLLARLQGGVAERLIKIAKPPLTHGRGGFPIESKTAAAVGKPPRLCLLGGFAKFY
jgi:hypothetical protein